VARDTTGLRFMVKHKDLSCSLFVDNLRNTRAQYANILYLSFTSPGFNRIATSQPRTIGIDFSYGFRD
jgi:hypothetical protein